MSYGIMPYAVNLSDVANVQAAGKSLLFKGKARKLSIKLKREYASEVLQLNEAIADLVDDDEPRPNFTAERALDDILFARPMNSQFGWVYGHALEMICEQLGRCLSNDYWTGMRSAWGDAVQESLNSAGVNPDIISVGHVMFRGVPIDIPEPDDFPSIGYVRNAELSPALRELEKAVGDSFEDDVAKAIDVMRGWLKVCLERRCDLVAFYY